MAGQIIKLFLFVSMLCGVAIAERQLGGYQKWKRGRAIKACKKSLNGKVITQQMRIPAVEPIGLDYEFCQVKVHVNKSDPEAVNLVVIGLESLDPKVPTIAATFIKNSPPVDYEKTGDKDFPSRNPSVKICNSYGGTQSNYQAVGLGWTYEGGQGDICMFGDGSRVSAWSLSYISNSNSTGYEAWAYIRESITDAQVFPTVLPFNDDVFDVPNSTTDALP